VFVSPAEVLKVAVVVLLVLLALSSESLGVESLVRNASEM
jgi:hypothetical protein